MILLPITHSLARGSGLGPPVQAVRVIVPHQGAVRQELLTLRAQGLAAQAPVPGLQIWEEMLSYFFKNVICTFTRNAHHLGISLLQSTTLLPVTAPISRIFCL